MSDLNKLKELRNALLIWQDAHEPTQDKEQFDMFGEAIDAIDRLEAAEALNNHLELAVRKAEGVSESLRRRVEEAENKLMLTHPAPAINLADLVPQKMTNPHQIAAEGTGWNDCIDAIIRNIEEANGQTIPAAKVGGVADTEVQAGSDEGKSK